MAGHHQPVVGVRARLLDIGRQARHHQVHARLVRTEGARRDRPRQLRPLQLGQHLQTVAAHHVVIGQLLPDHPVVRLAAGRHHLASRQHGLTVHRAIEAHQRAGRRCTGLGQRLLQTFRNTFHLVQPCLDPGRSQPTAHEGTVLDGLHQMQAQRDVLARIVLIVVTHALRRAGQHQREDVGGLGLEDPAGVTDPLHLVKAHPLHDLVEIRLVVLLGLLAQPPAAAHIGQRQHHHTPCHRYRLAHRNAPETKSRVDGLSRRERRDRKENCHVFRQRGTGAPGRRRPGLPGT